MQSATLIRFALIAGILMMFTQTLGSVFALAQVLDRVTADKVAQIAAME
jgi:hypothetical protein